MIVTAALQRAEPPHTLPDRLSMSFLQASSKCLRMASLDRDCDTSGEPATVGTILHTIAYRAGLLASLSGVEELTLEQFEQIARDVVRRPEEQAPLSLQGWRDVMRLVTKLCETQDFPAGAEYERLLTRALDGHVISARIDWVWIDGDLVCWVKDFKSGGKMAAREPTPQLEIYAWQLLGEHPDLAGFQLAEHALPYGEPWWIRMDADELTGPGSIEEWLSDMIARLEAAYTSPEPLKPSPGSHCDTMCPDKLGCPLPSWAKGAGVGTDAEARAAVDRITASRAQSAELTRAVKAYVEDNDLTSVRGSGDLEYAADDNGSFKIRKAREER